METSKELNQDHCKSKNYQEFPLIEGNPCILRFVAHSKRVISIALHHGWLPGARYTNLRDVREFDRLGFLDIDWENYNFKKHLSATKATNPVITVARDILDFNSLDEILDQASELSKYCTYVIVVPKDPRLGPSLSSLIPDEYLLGYSVPSSYGGTQIPPSCFNRPVHLLGGRPDVQRQLASLMPVVSLDCNRFTIDAAYGDHFDGDTFRPHPVGGYERCIEDSIININKLWGDYHPNGREVK